MDKVRQAAIFCVGRAVMFGWLAIFCVMFSLAFNPVIAFRAGAVMAMIMAGALVFKAFAVMHQNPKRTEVWIYLDDKTRPFNDPARRAYAHTLREVYAGYAQIVFILGCAFFAISLIFGLIGFDNIRMLSEHPIR